MTPREQQIYNDGERLVPGVTHNFEELVRHRSSYDFFRRIIEADPRTATPRIVDLGCGVGHGCYHMSSIPGSRVQGIDISALALEYATEKYKADNISYSVGDITGYIPAMQEFDYVISRHALEHVPDGLQLLAQVRFKYRMMIEVPYREDKVNPHHVLTSITESDFAHLDGVEIFFQDFHGGIFPESTPPKAPNSILCVRRDVGLPPISALGAIQFPVQPWEPTDPEFRQLLRDYWKLKLNGEASRLVRMARRLSWTIHKVRRSLS